MTSAAAKDKMRVELAKRMRLLIDGIGVTWDTLESLADELFPDNQEAGGINTVKIIVEINEGIASVRVEACPPGIRVDVDVRDYDTEGTDFTGMVEGEDYDTETTEGGREIRYLIGSGIVHEEGEA